MLLHLVQDVILLEPVEIFIREALTAGQASASGSTKDGAQWKGIKEGTKSVTFLQGTLQCFDPSTPSTATTLLDRVGYTPSEGPSSDIAEKLDVAWCQWCLGHLSDVDLISFLKRCKNALRDERSLIIVKENLCRDMEGGGPRTVFDPQDSSLTRYVQSKTRRISYELN